MCSRLGPKTRKRGGRKPREPQGIDKKMTPTQPKARYSKKRKKNKKLVPALNKAIHGARGIPESSNLSESESSSETDIRGGSNSSAQQKRNSTV